MARCKAMAGSGCGMRCLPALPAVCPGCSAGAMLKGGCPAGQRGFRMRLDVEANMA